MDGELSHTDLDAVAGGTFLPDECESELEIDALEGGL
jgi:hypothetical protein